MMASSTGFELSSHPYLLAMVFFCAAADSTLGRYRMLSISYRSSKASRCPSVHMPGPRVFICPPLSPARASPARSPAFLLSTLQRVFHISLPASVPAILRSETSPDMPPMISASVRVHTQKSGRLPPRVLESSSAPTIPDELFRKLLRPLTRDAHGAPLWAAICATLAAAPDDLPQSARVLQSSSASLR
ncbi:hypothetical protein BD311DRAFT_494857 [Dichomitus squalens]|uniref:Uncharacterized protein n=1 Tax=Dichomitus squalens TaxID=114155 RepID=A0A4V2JZL4_9APHY|nr:hypothetical protein BD311DRAFT_494857 [Dichomitus squalens]